MAKRIIWTNRAQNDKIAIFTYWNQRNKSTEYSKKLNKVFNETAELLALYPETGRATNRGVIRIKLIKQFLMIYEFSIEELHILAIFNSRQNLRKFDIIE